MNSHNLVEIAERIEKEIGFKLEQNRSKGADIIFKKNIGNDVHTVRIINRLSNSEINDYTILSEYHYHACLPFAQELSFKEYELFREFILALKYNFE